MYVSLVQTAPEKGQTLKNLQALDNLIGEGNGSDLYVMPEMFSQGQYIDPTEIVESMEGPTVSWLRNKAVQLKAALMGSVAIAEDGKFYNRMCMAHPDGTITTYNKRHLFGYSGESEHFTSGEDRVIVEYKGIRFLLQICYDLRFPIFSRCRNDYDVAVYVANWPVKRQLAWDTLLRARAIENQAYVIGVNRAGTDDFGEYDGHSVLIGPYGDCKEQAPDRTESVTKCFIDMEMLNHFRDKFPVLFDAD